MAAPRTLRFDRRMSDSEALMWRLEKDPALRSDFLNLTFLDREPDFDRFRRRMEDATVVIPRLRERVVASPGNLAPPEWSPDPSFDIDYHVRKVAVPSPGTDRQLLDFAAAHLVDAFDRARPLWQFTIVTGLEGGRAAYLSKMHHTITDDEGRNAPHAHLGDRALMLLAEDIPGPSVLDLTDDLVGVDTDFAKRL